VEDVVVGSDGFVAYLKDTVYHFTGINFDHDNPQTNAIDSANEAGQCWCFHGQQANMTIRLIMPMIPSEFFLHHISMDYYSETRIDMGTAPPKDFSVMGLDTRGQEFLLGDYQYNATDQKNKGLTQLFGVRENQGLQFQRVKVVFRASAWGPARKHTCVYQFGVHGKGVPKE